MFGLFSDNERTIGGQNMVARCREYDLSIQVFIKPNVRECLLRVLFAENEEVRRPFYPNK